MKKKGLHCCGFRYQHTYNGKLIEGRGNFLCISTIYDLYFLWDWIGRFSRGSNRTHVQYIFHHVLYVLYVCMYIPWIHTYMYIHTCRYQVNNEKIANTAEKILEAGRWKYMCVCRRVFIHSDGQASAPSLVLRTVRRGGRNASEAPLLLLQ